MNKLVNISPKKLWIFKCKEIKECSICPFSLSQTHKENGEAIDKESEVGKHLLEGVLEGQTKYEELETLLFNCPKCNQKWAASGEIPAGVRLAHAVNRGKSYEGSSLTCFACEKSN